jgi:3-methylcrotonyl-CoA carboxylase beta subunit
MSISKAELEFNKNEDAMRLLISDMKQRFEKEVEQGGGKKSMDKAREKGKMSPRERVQYLIDKGTSFTEIGNFAAYGMYAEQGGCPCAGTVGGLGYVNGRLCVVIANDNTVKAGAWFPMSGKKNLRLQEIAMENHLPVIYIVDSAGVYLPMQDEIFPDKEHFGRIFRNNAVMSGMGITQIAAVMGSCVAGGAYLPIMSDETLMVKENGSIFLAGPFLVKAAIGEDIDIQTLGGAATHNEISGIADYQFDTEQQCLDHVRKTIGLLGAKPTAGFDRIKAEAPLRDAKDAYGIVSADNSKQYDMHDLINCITDANSFEPFKNDYGKSIVCGYARVDGWAVGIVANQRKIIKSGKGEMQMGGVIYNDSADKAARFIMNCNQKKVPLVFLQDVTGFMVGSRSEHSGIIKDGAKLVNAVSNSVVPKITIVVGNSYGAGNYAMCGKAYDPRFIYAWPNAKMAVMGGEQAAKTLMQIQVAALKAKGQEITKEKETEILQEITAKYQLQTTCYYAAARLWVDSIIDPAHTRAVISTGIAAANQNTIMKQFNVGVFQV